MLWAVLKIQVESQSGQAFFRVCVNLLSHMAIHQTPPPTCLLACRAIATSAAREAMDVSHFRSAKFLFIIRGQRADKVLTVVT